MPIFIIAVVVIVLIVAIALILAKGTTSFDSAVQKNQETIDNQVRSQTRSGNSYNTALTMGHEIPINTNLEVQINEARVLAAKQAAALPRGGNMGIGRLGAANELQTAWKGVEKDPVTAVKIAAHHGWEGVRTGAVMTQPAAAPKAVPAATGKVELVPGKDYPFIEITDDMEPAEKRKARIANSKAKSAAKKAAKAAGASPAPAAATLAATPAPEAAAAPTADATMPTPPVFIELTDDMEPADKRTARIANSKAKSAYKKALKAAGIDPKSVKI